MALWAVLAWIQSGVALAMTVPHLRGRRWVVYPFAVEMACAKSDSTVAVQSA